MNLTSAEFLGDVRDLVGDQLVIRKRDLAPSSPDDCGLVEEDDGVEDGKRVCRPAQASNEAEVCEHEFALLPRQFGNRYAVVLLAGGQQVEGVDLSPTFDGGSVGAFRILFWGSDCDCVRDVSEVVPQVVFAVNDLDGAVFYCPLALCFGFQELEKVVCE